MTEPTAQGQEPTMEEILASIRRIISENDDPNAAAVPAKPASPSFASRPQAADDGVLELTDMVGADGKVVTLSATNGTQSVDIPEPRAKEEFPTMADPTPEPAPISKPADMPADDVELSAPESGSTEAEEALVAAGTAAASASAFAALAGQLSRKSGDSVPVAGSLPIGSGRTLEDLVKEMIRPMLREWLDANLPKLVERMVKREIERIALRAED
jgi:cell pole-organizing protein PopZ